MSMSKGRRTFNIQEFKEYINHQLKRTDSFANDSFKAGLCTALEHVLHNANSYKGYNQNYWIEKGCQEWQKNGEPDFPEKDTYIYGPKNEKYNRLYF